MLMTVFVVLLWGFASTTFLPKELRWPIFTVMAVCLSLGFTYIADKVVSAESMDWKLFKQATLLFYSDCLQTAVDQKLGWKGKEIQ